MTLAPLGFVMRLRVVRIVLAATLVLSVLLAVAVPASAAPAPRGCPPNFVIFNYTEFDDESAEFLESAPTLEAADNDVEVFVWGNVVEKAGSTAYFEKIDRTDDGILCVKWLWENQPERAHYQRVYNSQGFDPLYLFVLSDNVAAA